jgi:hypothetical protein
VRWIVSNKAFAFGAVRGDRLQPLWPVSIRRAHRRDHVICLVGDEPRAALEDLIEDVRQAGG